MYLELPQEVDTPHTQLSHQYHPHLYQYHQALLTEPQAVKSLFHTSQLHTDMRP